MESAAIGSQSPLSFPSSLWCVSPLPCLIPSEPPVRAQAQCIAVSGRGTIYPRGAMRWCRCLFVIRGGDGCQAPRFMLLCAVGGEWMLQLAVIVTGKNSRAGRAFVGSANLSNFVETHGRVSNSRLPACYSACGGPLRGLRARISRCTNVASEG